MPSIPETPCSTLLAECRGGHYDVAGDTAQPPDGLLDPFEGLRGRKAIEDVVADIRHEASSRHLRARLEGGPETRLENARQPAKEDATVRSIGPTMTKGCQDLDLRAPRGSSARDDCWNPSVRLLAPSATTRPTSADSRPWPPVPMASLATS